MKPRCRSLPMLLLLLLLRFLCITFLPAVLEAQEVEVPPEVTGYLRQNVTLPCKFIPRPEGDNITQVQWNLKPRVGEKVNIIVYDYKYGVHIHDTFLKGRVKVVDQSLIISNVEMRDAGFYTCRIAVFPSGSFEKTINLTVQEQMSLSSGVISAIVIAVLLLLVAMAAIVYLIFIRRHSSSVSYHVSIDTSGPVDVDRPLVNVREEDVVYSDVKLEPSRNATPSSNDRRPEAAHADDVTYSEVIVLHRQPK